MGGLRGVAIAGWTAAIALTAIAGCGRGERGAQTAGGLDSTVVAQGKAVYQANCAQCHGAQAEGAPNWREQNPDKTFPPPPHDSTGHTWHHSDGLLFRMVRDGGKAYEDPGFTSAMPVFGDRLSSEEIRAIITYFKSLWTPQQRAFQAQVSQGDPFP